MATTRVFKTVVLQPGESFTLPPDGEIIFTSNASGLSSECVIPETEDYVCQRFYWALNDDQSNSPALEHQDSKVYSLTISGTEYIIDLDTHAIYNGAGGGAAGDTAVEAALEPLLPDGIIVIDHMGHDETGARLGQDLNFWTFPSLVPNMKLKITGPGYPDALYVFPTAGTCTVTDPNGGS